MSAIRYILAAVVLGAVAASAVVVHADMAGPDLSDVHAVTTSSTSIDFATADRAAAASLTQFYSPITAKFDGPDGWWAAANDVIALVDEMRATGDRSSLNIVSDAYTDAFNGNTGDGKYYDDTAWWSLAWTDAYELTGDPRYLQTAENQLDYVASGWSSLCGGGVAWNDTPQGQGKNAISTEAYLDAAAELALVTHSATDLRRAELAWHWLDTSGLIQNGIVHDNLDLHTCKPDNALYTYNQGTVLAGLADLTQITGDPDYLTSAEQLADVSTANPALNPGGVLTDPVESHWVANDKGDEEFKGIYLRGLAKLNAALNGRYSAYIVHQATVMYQHDRGTGDYYGLHWAGPLADLNSYSQGAAVAALDAAVSTQQSAR